MILDQHPELRQLTPSEKLELVAELWDDLEVQQSSMPISAEHIAELNRREEEFERNPSQVTSWEAVKARLLRGRSLA